MLNDQLQEALNRHMNSEFFSSYMYLSMAAYFDSIHYKGFAHWAQEQANEELGHAMKMYQYILDKGGKIVLLPIEGPPTTWDSCLGAFEEVYKHEQKVTQQINSLYEICQENKDYATQTFLHWFITEQVEEESMSSEIVERIKLAGNSNSAVLLIDSELGSRKSE
ncbi:ferritin [Candidatus Uabimicrobium sp. HlEnr_7]|uniref:ferritin n=1 Tax=Candidatus Uabimicrobium helgolandensis TaxID=3095367 RepID=UPI003557555E